MISLNPFLSTFFLLQLPVLLLSEVSDDPMKPGSDYDGSSISMANMTLEYGARAYGFFSVFDRRKPYVLFHTLNGVQMLSDNSTCYPSFPIMPYAVTEDEVLYVEASPMDNYILMVNERRMVCLKNLIHR